MEIYKLPVYPLKRTLGVRQTPSPPISLPSSSTSETTSSTLSTESSSSSQSLSSSTSSAPPTSSRPPPSSSSSTPPDSQSSTSSSTSSDPASSSSLESSSSPSPSPSSSSSTPPASNSISSPPPTSPPPTLTPPPSSSPSTSVSNGFFLTTFNSSFITDINGTPTTIVTPIVTALRSPSSDRSTSSRTAIITGSALGGAAIVIAALAALFFFRRRATKRRYSFLARKTPPSRAAFLAGEDMDDHPATPGFHDDPFARGGPAAQEQYELPPRLFRPRASESGSIFQEAVWPPPAAGSRLTDPLASAGAVGGELSRIVDDVMGPGPPGHETPRLRGGSYDAVRDSLELRGFGALAPPPHDRARDTSIGSYTALLLDEDDSRDLGYSPSPLILTNPDSEEPPLTPPPAKNWLERSPNPSPKVSPRAPPGDL